MAKVFYCGDSEVFRQIKDVLEEEYSFLIDFRESDSDEGCTECCVVMVESDCRDLVDNLCKKLDYWPHKEYVDA